MDFSNQTIPLTKVLKAMPHVTISSTIDFNVAKIASSTCIVMKSSTIGIHKLLKALPHVMTFGRAFSWQSVKPTRQVETCM